jgi:uncharacterized protein (UPF0332 family)
VADRLVKARMNQAREALEEAKALLEGDMDVGLVLNSLYYAFYYPVIALVYQGQVPSTMQSVVIGLFDRQFIEKGTFPAEFSEAIHRVFELKPKCGQEGAAVDADEIIRLLTAAKDFVVAASLYLQLHQDR